MHCHCDGNLSHYRLVTVAVVHSVGQKHNERTVIFIGLTRQWCWSEVATLQTAVLAYQAVNKRKKTNQMKRTIYASECIELKTKYVTTYLLLVLQTDSVCLADKVKTVLFER